MIQFSVIIPSYNRASLIAETIDSVLRQTYPHFEIIIADDGSTDNTGQVIEERYTKEPRVRYFYKKNEERGAARNFALGLAKGDYAVFLDSDDLMNPDYLGVLNNIIENIPGIHFLAAKYRFSDPMEDRFNNSVKCLEEGWYDRNFFLRGNALACNYCIKISDRSYKPFPDERELASMEDWLFLLLNLENEKIFIRDEICLTMRQHHERSMTDNQKVIDARKRATEWALRNINLTGNEQKVLKAWSHYFCGIHQYLDHKRKEAMKESLDAMKLAGLNSKFIFLLLKSIIGRRIIKEIR